MTATPIEPPTPGLPDELEVDLLILPRRLGPAGEALYDDSVVTLAKELRAEGVSADYLHRAEERRWIGEKSATALLVAFVVGIGSNAGWTALCALVRRRRTERTRVRVARKKDHAAQEEWEWFDVEGTGEAVARALEALEGSSGEDDPKTVGEAEKT